MSTTKGEISWLASSGSLESKTFGVPDTFRVPRVSSPSSRSEMARATASCSSVTTPSCATQQSIAF